MDVNSAFRPSNGTKIRIGTFRAVLSIIVLVTLASFTLGLIIFGTGSPSNNFYEPKFDESTEITFYDLKDSQGSGVGWERSERVLFCVPLRDAASHLPMFFGHMKNLTYPHNSIDLAFLVSDSKDDTMGHLIAHLKEVQSDPDTTKRFGSIDIYEKDFGAIVGQSFSDRHGFQAQGPRRKLMARARNWLWSVALRPDHSWVYWRDADVETVPPTILEDLMHHNKDVIVPNVWRPLPDWLGNMQPYDLNSWQESDGGRELAESLSEDAVIVEGYPDYNTWRPHLAYLRDPYGDPELEYELDGIGGVSILAKASVFRNGAHFPAFSFKKHAETEGLGKMCRRMGLSVIGLPHYTIWHIYEPSSDDLKHMAWMAQEEERQKQEAKEKAAYLASWDKGFADVQEDWGFEKSRYLKGSDRTRKIGYKKLDWSGQDDFDQQAVPIQFDPNDGKQKAPQDEGSTNNDENEEVKDQEQAPAEAIQA